MAGGVCAPEAAGGVCALEEGAPGSDGAGGPAGGVTVRQTGAGPMFIGAGARGGCPGAGGATCAGSAGGRCAGLGIGSRQDTSTVVLAGSSIFRPLRSR